MIVGNGVITGGIGGNWGGIGKTLILTQPPPGFGTVPGGHLIGLIGGINGWQVFVPSGLVTKIPRGQRTLIEELIELRSKSPMPKCS